MQVERLDHVHIEVRDRDVAAGWYERVLGLVRHPEFADWAADPMGPLIMAGGDGSPTLSLFARDCRPPSRDTTVAFRVSGNAFLGFMAALPKLRLQDHNGATLDRACVVDHHVSWSLYFVDPDLNRLEVTTYDYAMVRASSP